jgi:hypothetical protein
MCALEAAAGLNVRPAQDAALCLITLRHMNLRGDMPRERVCCVPPRASDKESGNAFIALFDGTPGLRVPQGQMRRIKYRRRRSPATHAVDAQGRSPPAPSDSSHAFLPWTTLLSRRRRIATIAATTAPRSGTCLVTVIFRAPAPICLDIDALRDVALEVPASNSANGGGLPR